MAALPSLADRLHSYRLFYHELSAAQSGIPPGELHCREARSRQAELRMLEELIMLFADTTTSVGLDPRSANPPTTTANDDPTNTSRPTSDNPDMDSVDVSLVTDILLLSPASPWILYVGVWSGTEWQLCYVSPSVKRLLGWRPSDVLGKPVWQGCHREDLPILQQIFHDPKGVTMAATSSCSAASSSWRAEKSHAFGDFVTFRRVRRDHTVASMHGTGIAIGSRWYAWVEQDTSALQLALLGSPDSADCMTLTSDWPLATNPEKVLAMDARNSWYKEGFQPSTIVVDERAVDSNPEEGNRKKRFQPPAIVVEEIAVESKPVERKHQKGYQPHTIVVGERHVESELVDGNQTKGAFREVKTASVTNLWSPPPAARSEEAKNRKPSVEYSSRPSRTSSIESLPAHIDISPRMLPNLALKFNDVHDKIADVMRGKTVLLVDDSHTYLKGGQALLAKLGCRVFIAHNGEEALQMMQYVSPVADQPRQFDMIFMDLSMPKMDGIQAVKLFRIWEANQHHGRAHTLIIAVTANDTDGGMVLCAQTGFDGFVTKPLNKKKILDCLANLSNEIVLQCTQAVTMGAQGIEVDNG